jgi:hypothetical protein
MQPGRSLLALGLTLVSMCHRGGGIQPLMPVVSDARVYYDDSPAIRDSARLIVRDAAEWQTQWRRATALQATPPPVPAIDFNREMAVLVAAGRMTPGDQIHVDSAGVQGDYFVVWVRTLVQCRRFSGDVYPLEIVRVRESDKPPHFVERRERGASCS